MKKKLLITGFPHCGTSILKTKLGECTNVYEQIDESVNPYPNDLDKFNKSDKEFFIWKDPIVRNRGERNHITIMIIRNPYYVFTSQIQRGLDPFKTKLHTYKDYLNTAKIFLNSKKQNVYCIKYEDLFEDNNSKIKSIMDEIGLKYNDNIFEKKTKLYSIGDEFSFDLSLSDGTFPEKFTPRKNPGKYRYWQINQDFKNFNESKKIDIPKKLEKILKESEIVTKLGYNG
jgi:hypothetical protein